MISEDRIKLNERFKIVYEGLKERGEIVKHHPEKSNSAFAEKILGSKQYGHIIGHFLKGKRPIDYKHVYKLRDFYGVSEAYMLHGLGNPFDQSTPLPSLNSFEQNYSEQVSPIFQSPNNKILFTSVSAFAGTSIDAGGFASEESEIFSIPGMSGNDLVSFPVDGNSMEPVIQNGDILICKPLQNLEEINDNDIYAIKNNGSVWIKNVKKIQNRVGKITQLKLISANYLEYDPFIEDVNEQTRLYKVIRRISEI